MVVVVVIVIVVVKIAIVKMEVAMGSIFSPTTFFSSFLLLKEGQKRQPALPCLLFLSNVDGEN